MLSFLHLTIFEALLRLKSVTQTAEALDMPQPTLSRHLKHLREHFQDPLFVRTRGGLEPTSAALSASPAITEALDIYRNQLSGPARFDAAKSQRNFFLAASDLGHLLTLPRVEKWASGSAPNVRFTAVPLRRNQLIAQLELGEVDVAIGSFPNLYAGIKEQTLFQEDYVCIVPKSLHLTGPLTLERYKQARHVLVDGHAIGHSHEEVEKTIISIVGGGQVRIVAENFLLSAHIAEQSELILTVPARVAKIINPQHALVLKPPVDLPGFSVKQYWHERFDQDPGNIWLRSIIAHLRQSEI